MTFYISALEILLLTYLIILYAVDRYYWDAWDPVHVCEGLFAVGNILNFTRLFHLLAINEHLGPMLISLERMIKVSSTSVFYLFAFESFVTWVIMSGTDQQGRKSRRGQGGKHVPPPKKNVERRTVIRHVPLNMTHICFTITITKFHSSANCSQRNQAVL